MVYEASVSGKMRYILKTYSQFEYDDEFNIVSSKALSFLLDLADFRASIVGIEKFEDDGQGYPRWLNTETYGSTPYHDYISAEEYIKDPPYYSASFAFEFFEELNEHEKIEKMNNLYNVGTDGVAKITLKDVKRFLSTCFVDRIALKEYEQSSTSQHANGLEAAHYFRVIENTLTTQLSKQNEVTIHLDL